MPPFRSLQSTPDHLPEDRRARLRAITEALCAQAPVGMLILFGSHARGDQVDDPETGYASDFDLLVVVETEALAEDLSLWTKATATAKALAGGTPVQIIVHDVRYLNAEIRLGNYFFLDILREGILLFDAHHFELATPKALTRAEMLAVAEHNFTYWFGTASGFLLNSRYGAAHGRRPEAAFLLHQATERYYHALLLVLTAYKPRTHNLAELGERAEIVCPPLAGALPRTGTPEDEHLFDLLKRAYIEARYSKGYRITDDELAALEARVRVLAGRIRTGCLARMEQLCGPAAVRGDLPDVPPLGEPLLEALPMPAEPEALEGWKLDLIARSKGEGRVDGRAEGLVEGKAAGLVEGKAEGLTEGELKGKAAGLVEGKAEGLTEGELKGKAAGLVEGKAEGELKGKAEGLVEGELRGRAESVLALLAARGLPVGDDVRARILGCRDEATLVRWLQRATTASGAAEVTEG